VIENKFGALDKVIGKISPILNRRRRALKISHLQPAGAVV
jgi:hypothetical protein